jgi:hypothetical protein
VTETPARLEHVRLTVVSEVQDYRITGLQDYRITGLQDYRITGLQDYRITGLQDCPPVQLNGFAGCYNRGLVGIRDTQRPRVIALAVVNAKINTIALARYPLSASFR